MLAADTGADARRFFSVDPARPALRLVPGAGRAVPDVVRERSEKIARFFSESMLEAPCLALDLDVVEANYHALDQAFGDAVIYYAIKANPAVEILDRLIGLGARFDCASLNEIRLVLSRGAAPEAISFGNTIKKEREIAAAFAAGVRLFAFDSDEELRKIARSAPGASVFCRLLTDGDGADWPLSRKFGCSPTMAFELLTRADALGLDVAGASFHVGSQQTKPENWRGALEETAALYRKLEAGDIKPWLINLGGGMPARYRADVPETGRYGQTVMDLVEAFFGDRRFELIVEPGRGLVGDAGIIQAEVVLVSKKDEADEKRWVYLDIGKFGGLAETMEEAIRYPIVTERDAEAGGTGPVCIAGPTCDSADTLYETADYRLPLTLKAGDRVWILGCGAYTTTYASVGFNGFPPLDSVCL